MSKRTYGHVLVLPSQHLVGTAAEDDFVTMSFINADLSKLAQALEVTFSRTTKSYHSQTYFNNILRIYLNEKLNFYHHILMRNAQMHIRLENLVY